MRAWGHEETGTYMGTQGHGDTGTWNKIIEFEDSSCSHSNSMVTSFADGFRRLATGRSTDYVLVSTTKYTRKDAAYSAYVRTSIVRKLWCVKFCCCQKNFQSCLGDLNALKYLFHCTVHYNHIKCLIFVVLLRLVFQII